MRRRRRVLLVDVENVGMMWTKAIPYLEATDLVYLFMAESTRASVSMEQIKLLRSIKCEIEYERVFVGQPEALDFQLCAKLGALTVTAPKTQYFIVSRDKGYEPLTQYFKAQGKEVLMIQTSPDFAKLKIEEKKEKPQPKREKQQSAQPKKVETLKCDPGFVTRNWETIAQNTEHVSQIIRQWFPQSMQENELGECIDRLIKQTPMTIPDLESMIDVIHRESTYKQFKGVYIGKVSKLVYNSVCNILSDYRYEIWNTY